MKCESCGANLKKGDKFCSVCGKECVKAKKVEDNPKKKEIDKRKESCLIIGLVSLILSCWLPIVGLPLAIVAMAKGSKLKKETEKVEPGFILGLIGLILSIICLIILIFITFIIVVAALKGVRDGAFKDIHKKVEENIEEKIDELEFDGQKIGNIDLGYIYIPEDWEKEKVETKSGEDVIAYSNEDGDESIRMSVYTNPTDSVEEYASREKANLEAFNTTNIVTSIDTYIINYSVKAKKVGGHIDGKYLYTWIFEDDNNNIHKVTLQAPSYDIDVFNIINSYRFTDTKKSSV